MSIYYINQTFQMKISTFNLECTYCCIEEPVPPVSNGLIYRLVILVTFLNKFHFANQKFQVFFYQSDSHSLLHINFLCHEYIVENEC